MPSQPVLRINFATDTLGCGVIVMLLAVPVLVWLIAFADLSDSNARGADFFRMLQSSRIAGIPVGALLLGGYFIYELSIWAWRWTDQVALGLTDDRLLFHRSIKRTAVSLAELDHIAVTYQTNRRVRTINPSLIVNWTEPETRTSKRSLIRNIDLRTGDAQAFRESLLALGKWVDDRQTD
jgi:hypothetical protein